MLFDVRQTLSGVADRAKLIENIAYICFQIASGENVDSVAWYSIDLVRLCSLSIWLYDADNLTGNYCAEWSTLWEAIPPAMQRSGEKYSANTGQGNERPGISNLALDSLLKLQQYDNPAVDEDMSYEIWTQRFDQDKTVFPDSLYEELARFTANTAWLSIYRLKRLKST